MTKTDLAYNIIKALADENGIARFHYEDIARMLTLRGVKTSVSSIGSLCRQLVARGRLIRLTPQDRAQGATYKLTSTQLSPTSIPAQIVVVGKQVREAALKYLDYLAQRYIACTDSDEKTRLAKQFDDVVQAFFSNPQEVITTPTTVSVLGLTARLRHAARSADAEQPASSASVA